MLTVIVSDLTHSQTDALRERGGCVGTRSAGTAVDRYGSTLREQVQERLQNLILTGTIAAGSRLNESEIAGELNVSRGPVREAIQRLASDGLVVMEPHRGAYVRSLNAADVAELYEMRIAIEVHAARLAARRGGAELNSRLRELLEQTSEIVGQDGEVHYPSTLDIHQAVLAGCADSRMQRVAAAVHKELALARARSGYEPARARAALKEHYAIVHAVIDGDEQRAADAMYEHLQAASQHIKLIE